MINFMFLLVPSCSFYCIQKKIFVACPGILRFCSGNVLKYHEENPVDTLKRFQLITLYYS